MFLTRALSVLRAETVGYKHVRAHLQDDSGNIWTFPAYDAQAEAISNNIGGRVCATAKVTQFSDTSLTWTLTSVSILVPGTNGNPREYRRKSRFADLPAELAKLTNGAVGITLTEALA